MSLSLRIASDNVLELQSLKNTVTDALITDATVTAIMVDRSGDQVTGEAWPVTLVHDAAGTYRVVLSNQLAIVANRTYRVDITVIGAGGEKLTIRRSVTPVYEDGM